MRDDDRDVQYYRPSLAQIKERLEEITSRAPAPAAPRTTKLRWYGVSTPGRHVLRILPPWSDELEFYVDHDSHFDIPGSSQRWVTCQRSFGSPCPICEACDTLAGAGLTSGKLKPYRARERSFFNALMRGREHEGVRTVEVPRWIMEDRVLQFFRSAGDITHPDSGTDIVVESTGVKYKVRLGDRGPMLPGDLNGEATRAILTHLPNLRKILGRVPGQWVHDEAEKAAQALLGQYRHGAAPPTPSTPLAPAVVATVAPNVTVAIPPSPPSKLPTIGASNAIPLCPRCGKGPEYGVSPKRVFDELTPFGRLVKVCKECYEKDWEAS